MGQIHVFAVFLLYSGHIFVELFVTSFQPRGKRMKRRQQSLVRRQDWAQSQETSEFDSSDSHVPAMLDESESRASLEPFVK